MNANREADDLAKQELNARLSLIESMIAEGRQKTESWGWTFVLWGAAYAAAICFANLGSPIAAWTTFGHHELAWPITMGVALLAMYAYIAVIARKKEHQPDTTMGRAIFSIWIGMGISMFLLLLAMGISNRLDQQTFVSIVAAMLGLTNAASSMILKWRLQFLCAAAWWIASVAACFASVSQSTMIFLTAIFLCQIVFGIYNMIAERKLLAQKSGAVHA